MLASSPARHGLLLALALAGCTEPILTDPDHHDDVVTGPPLLSIGVTVVDFGDVSYGQAYSEQIHAENVGGEDLVMSNITATAPFTASYTTDVTITPGGSTTLVVRYQPAEYAAHEGTFSLDWNVSDDDTAVDAGHWSIPLYGVVVTDEDGDGHDCEGAGGDDCDDGDDRTYPNATETWYDGNDQDCMGDDDYDQDGDGFQVAAYNPSTTGGGGDCNDANAEIYPGAPDVWYDNVDSNCDDRDDWDQDNDGYKTTLGDHGSDCDDTDGSISPGAEEDPSNGIDDDCDGRVDES
ncbi:MAG: MopE-related protein [Pseudomonadota bacterium]